MPWFFIGNLLVSIDRCGPVKCVSGRGNYKCRIVVNWWPKSAKCGVECNWKKVLKEKPNMVAFHVETVKVIDNREFLQMVENISNDLIAVATSDFSVTIISKLGDVQLTRFRSRSLRLLSECPVEINAMTNRGKYSAVQLEAEIEKCRVECNWKKVIELAEVLKEKPNMEYLSMYLIGEGTLETCFDELGLGENLSNDTEVKLRMLVESFNSVTNDTGKKAGVALDAFLLLGKTYYALRDYQMSTKCLNSVDLDSYVTKNFPSLTLPNLRILAESFGIKAFCLEKEIKTCPSILKSNELYDQMIKCYKMATEISLQYFQKLEKKTNTSSMSSTSAALDTVRKPSPIMERSILQLPKRLLEKKHYPEAIESYRTTLNYVETESFHEIRLTLMKQLVQHLLGSAMNIEYVVPKSPHKVSTAKWKPTSYSSLNQFIPRNEYEEILVLLLLSETIATRDAVLSQSAEFHETQERAYKKIVEIYDLLCIATVRWNQMSLLHESLERAMKFSFEKAHVWHQFGLTLIALERYDHAVSVMTEVSQLLPYDSSVCLMIAKVCYEHLSQYSEGIQWSQKAKSRENQNFKDMLGRCELYIGIGYHLLASKSILIKEKVTNNDLALKSFKKAVQLEPNDYLCWYYLALQTAITDRNLSKAIAYTNESIECRADCSVSLQLLTIILSAHESHSKALQIVRMGLKEFPECLNLYYIKASLQLGLEGAESALDTAKQMLEIWKSLYDVHTNRDNNNSNNADSPDFDPRYDTRSYHQQYYPASDKDSCSLQIGHDLVALRVEKALSEMASTLESSNRNVSIKQHDLILLEIWLLLGELYLELDQVSEAELCLNEAVQIFPSSHHVMYMRGLISFHQEDWIEAKRCFQNAVFINSHYVKSLTHLGLVYHYLGFHRLAEFALRRAVTISPRNFTAWYNLGKVLESLEESEASSDCFAIALSVENQCPVLDYDILPICFD